MEPCRGTGATIEARPRRALLPPRRQCWAERGYPRPRFHRARDWDRFLQIRTRNMEHRLLGLMGRRAPEWPHPVQRRILLGHRNPNEHENRTEPTGIPSV